MSDSQKELILTLNVVHFVVATAATTAITATAATTTGNATGPSATATSSTPITATACHFLYISTADS